MTTTSVAAQRVTAALGAVVAAAEIPAAVLVSTATARADVVPGTNDHSGPNPGGLVYAVHDDGSGKFTLAVTWGKTDPDDWECVALKFGMKSARPSAYLHLGRSRFR